MTDFATLKRILRRIDRRGYKAYKDIAGGYTHESLQLFIDYVQGDPFASPSKVRLRLSADSAMLPEKLFNNKIRRIALQDFLARRIFDAICRNVSGRRGSGKSGLVSIDVGGQEVLDRTAVLVTEKWIEARLQVGLPAAGRSVLGHQAEELLCEVLPQVAIAGLSWERLPQKKACEFVECVENQEYIRGQLESKNLVAFVAEEAVLPRESGASNRPLREQVVPFRSPDQLRIVFDLPNKLPDGSQQISGMGIPKGVTLIVGGGYHGKSTLLKALELSVYPHIPGDGREYVITDSRAVKIRAEDGRSVQQVDISPFISNIPHGRSTVEFTTEDASGSTSQAANIVEAVEAGAKVLLLDEDTSATNFMLRDARMQSLVHKDHEPITPFVDRVRELFDLHGVSTVLVMGGCGDYFDAADKVIMMKEYIPFDVSQEAAVIAERVKSSRKVESAKPFADLTPRIPLGKGFDASRGKRDVKIDAKGIDLILFGRESVDLRAIEQIVDPSQTRAIGSAIYLAADGLMDGGKTLAEILLEIEQELDAESLDCLDPFRRAGRHPGNFARPRKFEIAAAMNRFRSLRIKQKRN